MYGTFFYAILLLIALLNVVGFVLVGVDKERSVRKDARVPEVYLFFIATFFASLGVLVGMFLFRHKTSKIYFPLGVGALLVEQAFIIYAATALWGAALPR